MSERLADKLISKHKIEVREKRRHVNSLPSLKGHRSNSVLVLGFVGDDHWVWICTECSTISKSKETRLRDCVIRCECDPLIHRGSLTDGRATTPAMRKAFHAFKKMLNSGKPLCKKWASSDGFTNFITDLGEQPDTNFILYIHPLADECNSKTVRWVNNGLKLYKKYPKTFISYRAMIDRCANQKRYEGVIICDRWLYGEDDKLPFTCFVEDMGVRKNSRLTIDREDGNKGYSPDNCRWATAQQQRINQRTRVRLVKVHGENITIAELARRAGMSWGMANTRLRSGMKPSTIIRQGA